MAGCDTSSVQLLIMCPLCVGVGGGEVIIASLNLIVTFKLELFVIFMPSSASV